MLTAQVVGMEEFAARLRRAALRASDLAADWLDDELDGVLERAVELAPLGVDDPNDWPYPHEAGLLKRSGYVDGPHPVGSEVVASIGFETGHPRNYEWVQHERMDYAHPRGGQAKYLEEPLAGWHDRAGPELVQALERGLD